MCALCIPSIQISIANEISPINQRLVTEQSEIINLNQLNDTFIDFQKTPADNFENSDLFFQNTSTDFVSPNIFLSNLKAKNSDRLLVGHLNINFVAKKFQVLKSIFQGKLDILALSESKLDQSFPDSQFFVEGYEIPFRLDRNKFGGGLLLYIRNDIPCKEIKIPNLPCNIEALFIEINIRKTRWLVMTGYNPHKENISYFLNHISLSLDQLIAKYENIILLGDFNSEMKEEEMGNFCDIYNLKNLIFQSTCFKNPNNPSSIDVMLTNRKKSFTSSTAIETGLSDHHKLTISVLKTYFKKQDPITIKYRCYKNFNNVLFRKDLLTKLQSYIEPNMGYDDFKSIFMKSIDKHAPVKQRTIRGNNSYFMNRNLSKAFMDRSRLKNKFNQNPSLLNKTAFKKQRNFCVNLLSREKKKYYNNLDMKVFTDNKKFWRSIKPLFSDKNIIFSRNIILSENETIISDNENVANTLNDYFVKVVDELDIEHFEVNNLHDILPNKMQEIINKFKLHPSIIKIKETVKLDDKFIFRDEATPQTKNCISRLNPKKSSVENDIPMKMLILTNDICSKYITNIYNDAIHSSVFPKSLKEANVTPIFKKGDKTAKQNYRPISLLPCVSKLFERHMYNQIIAYIDNKLSPYLFGFRKGHSSEQCLTVMLESWKKALDEKKVAGAILTDLSKAFDCLNHELIIAKLDAYGFHETALEFIYSYLKERKQKTNVNGSYSHWCDLNYGVPQGSILGLLLFNIFINDIFFFMKDCKIANYADDNTCYAIANDITDFINILESDTDILLKWFQFNGMKSNNTKFHLIVANKAETSINIENDVIHGKPSVILQGVSIDNSLTFTSHVSTLCKKANQKLHALSRIAKYICKDKLKNIMKAFILSQFNHCPLTWMFHSRTLNTKINKLHERALRIVYKDVNLSFKELLEKDGSMSIHHRNLQRLAIEMFKVKYELSSPLMEQIFTKNTATYNFRKDRDWVIPETNSVLYGTETVRYRGPLTWNMIPAKIKISSSLNEFKTKIKKWKPENCTCRLCKDYIYGVGFI